MVLGASVVTLAVVFAWRQSGGDSQQTIDLLYVVPVALVALELGLVAGLACAGLALALVGIWVLTSDGDLGVVGALTALSPSWRWAPRLAASPHHMRDAQLRLRRLLESGLSSLI